MESKRRYVAMLFLVVCALLSMSQARATTLNDAQLAVTDASNALRGAFVDVSSAETAGANVSALVSILTAAGDELTAGMAALNSGNYDDAAGNATACESLSLSISTDAAALEQAAAQNSANRWLVLVFSLAGSAVFASLLFLAWRKFKRYYKTRLLESKPEVNPQCGA
ncbi:MAG: hypothetical protein ACE14S_12155 [Candidatus Bathyarchaeia archaeon]